ncbi:MAG: sugar transferase [candidate division KSB1 bacterium]|nr:sugar transferase [candidate division KSB1 bacterium]
MLRLRHKLLIHAFRLSDQLILIGSLLVLIAVFREGGSFRYLRELPISVHSPINAFGAMSLLVTWAVVFHYLVRYDANRFTSLGAAIWGVVKATATCTFILFLVGEMFAISLLSNTVVALFFPVTCLLAIGSRVVLRFTLGKLRESGLNCRYLALVGTHERALQLARRIEARPELGYRIAGFIAENGQTTAGSEAEQHGWKIVGRLSEFREFLEKDIVDEVLVCLPLKERFRDVYDIIQLCRDLGVVVRFAPDMADVKAFAGAQIEVFEGDCVVTFFRERLLGQLLVKRILDVVGSAVLLILLSPLFLLVAVLIKLDSPGPVFFVQERMGMNKRKFKLLKFRSMFVDAEQRKAELLAHNEQTGPVFKMKNDPRVTRVGRWLRKLSIDELPQLINVLKGEMSLVGPRPPLPSEVEQYDWLYRRRLSIRPGITCLWQISGRSEIKFQQWMELDRQYIDNWSIWLDLKILLKTIPAVLRARGAA